MQRLERMQYNSDFVSPRPSRRGFGAYAPGSALISALVFTVIIALALAGMGTLTVSHYNLAHVQAASSESLDLAEAGINWELHKLTMNGIGSADDGTTTYNASNTIDKISNSLPGTFKVSCATTDGSALTANTNLFTITCTAFIQTATGAATRTVRINAQPYSTFYTLYSMRRTSYTQDGIVVNGVSGTNGTQSVSAGVSVAPNISSVVFNGDPKATQSVGNQGSTKYNVTHNPNALKLQGTTDIVNAKFPGGETYLQTNNDNNLAVMNDPSNPNSTNAFDPKNPTTLSASGSQTITLKGKPGGANYYFTGINMTGHSNLVFDNTNGPITIYHLNFNGFGSLMRGGHAIKSLQEAPGNAVKMYLSATGGLSVSSGDPIPGMSNSTEVDMGIYDFDTHGSSSNAFGSVRVEAGTSFKGQIISNDITLKGSTNIVGQKGYFDTPSEYYGFSGAWSELNSAGDVGGANQ